METILVEDEFGRIKIKPSSKQLSLREVFVCIDQFDEEYHVNLDFETVFNSEEEAVKVARAICIDKMELRLSL